MSATDPVTPDPRCFSIRVPRPLWIGLATTVLIAVCVGGAFWIHQGIEQEKQEKAANSAFRFVMLALVNYENANHCLPKPVLVDDEGKPRASWRFLILNYAEAHKWYFPDESRPWILTDNTEMDVREFTKDTTLFSFWEKSVAHATRIAAVVGPDSAFDERNRCSFAQMDSDTILVVEVKNVTAHWTEPGDYTWEGGHPDVASTNSMKIGSNGGRGFHVAFKDYTVWFLSADTPIAELARFFTVQGAKENDRDAVLGRYRL